MIYDFLRLFAMKYNIGSPKMVLGLGASINS